MTAASVGPSDVPRRSLGFRVRRVESGLVIGFKDQALELSDSAELIYRCMDGRRTVADVAAVVAAEYGIEEAQALADVAEFIDELAAHGIVTIQGV
ncbi:PqqD family protein [Streptomyces phyllanthi]|uniref:PqqD family protein n=1 Tax=Streptomyces phyllanthi TaxID=1803180 RepID=A0A5N8VTQ6_9ACTN|nr:PqqD family protein [Streptomyces phyllanthi]MPY38620.1 PqqD family protein [Streptomyces phyllanthi]